MRLRNCRPVGIIPLLLPLRSTMVIIVDERRTFAKRQDLGRCAVAPLADASVRRQVPTRQGKSLGLILSQSGFKGRRQRSTPAVQIPGRALHIVLAYRYITSKLDPGKEQDNNTKQSRRSSRTSLQAQSGFLILYVSILPFGDPMTCQQGRGAEMRGKPQMKQSQSFD